MQLFAERVEKKVQHSRKETRTPPTSGIHRKDKQDMEKDTEGEWSRRPLSTLEDQEDTRTRSVLSQQDAETLVQAFGTSGLDGCSS